MEAILFLIGIQEFGDIRKKFSKNRNRPDAYCGMFSFSGKAIL